MDPYDVLLTCAYDPSHRIRKGRLQCHIYKCSKNHLNSTKVLCPYDATHVIERVEYEHHTANCPSSGNVMNSKYSLEPPISIGVPIENACAKETVMCDEDWEGGNQTYDPYVLAENKAVTRIPIAMSKAERKKFRKTERLRIAALPDSIGRNATVCAVKEPEMDKPLRIPKNAAKALSIKENTEKTSENDTTIDDIVLSFRNVSTNEADVDSEIKEMIIKKNTSSDNWANVSLKKKDMSKQANISQTSKDGTWVVEALVSQCQGQNINEKKNDSNVEENILKDKSNIPRAETNTSQTKKENCAKINLNDGKNGAIEKDLRMPKLFSLNNRCASSVRGLNGMQKISTGRGFMIAYENLQSELFKQNKEDCDSEISSSVYGYDEGEEIDDLDFHDVDLQKKQEV